MKEYLYNAIHYKNSIFFSFDNYALRVGTIYPNEITVYILKNFYKINTRLLRDITDEEKEKFIKALEPKYKNALIKKIIELEVKSGN
jgi:hypothetical protein